jgi:hypothetical protein
MQHSSSDSVEGRGGSYGGWTALSFYSRQRARRQAASVQIKRNRIKSLQKKEMRKGSGRAIKSKQQSSRL